MIRPAPLAGLAALGGGGLLLAAQALLPERLTPWLGGRPDPLALSLQLSRTLSQQEPLVVMVQACPQPQRLVLDLSGLTPERLRWTAKVRTLVIHAPRPAPVQRAAAPAKEQAVCGTDDAVTADEAAREILRRQFLLPLVAAGHEDIKVKVTFAAPPPTSTPQTDVKE